MPQRGAGASRKRGGAGGGLGPRAGNGGGRLSVRKMRGSHTTQPLPWLPHALCKNTEKMRKTGRHHAICRQTGTKPHHNGHASQPRGYSFMNIRMLPNVRRKKTFSGIRRYFQELEGGRRRKREVEDICWRKTFSGVRRRKREVEGVRGHYPLKPLSADSGLQQGSLTTVSYL